MNRCSARAWFPVFAGVENTAVIRQSPGQRRAPQWPHGWTTVKPRRSPKLQDILDLFLGMPGPRHVDNCKQLGRLGQGPCQQSRLEPSVVMQDRARWLKWLWAESDAGWGGTFVPYRVRV
jgi:hypothetical protein